MPSLTKAQIEARRRAAREWKARNRHRRTKDGYVDGPVARSRRGRKPGQKPAPALAPEPGVGVLPAYPLRASLLLPEDYFFTPS